MAVSEAADESPVWEAESSLLSEVELAVSEASESPEEEVEEAVWEEVAEELVLEELSSSVWLPHSVARQAAMPSASSGCATTHCSMYSRQTYAGRVCS